MTVWIVTYYDYGVLREKEFTCDAWNVLNLASAANIDTNTIISIVRKARKD